MDKPLQHLDRLTDKQALFARECAKGIPVVQAAANAGYSCPEQSSYLLKSNPMVQAAIVAEVRRFLHVEAAPAGIRLMYDFMQDPTLDKKLRLACTKTIADRAGYIPPKAKDNSGLDGKSVLDMTADEMKDMAERIRRELADRAAPIIDNAPSVARNEDEAFDIFE